MKMYGLVSKGLNVKGARISGFLPILVFRGNQFTNKKDAEKYLDRIPYINQRNLKVAVVYDSNDKDRYGRYIHKR